MLGVGVRKQGTVKGDVAILTWPGVPAVDLGVRLPREGGGEDWPPGRAHFLLSSLYVYVHRGVGREDREGLGQMSNSQLAFVGKVRG